MSSNPRALTALGLGLVGLAALVAPTSGQDNAPRTAARAPGRTPAIIGSVDIQAVLKAYQKVEFLNKQLETEMQLKTAELNKMMGEYQEAAKQIEQFQPNSADFKNLEDKITGLQARIQTERERAQRDLGQRQAEAIATVYKEIQAMVGAVAKANGMTYVLQVNNEPISSENPDAVLAATMQSVVYADPASGMDITQMVINYLNSQYQKANPSAANAAAAPVDPATAPASTRPPAPATGAAAPPAARPPAGAAPRR